MSTSNISRSSFPAESINSVSLSGRVVKDCQMRKSINGELNILSFTLAVDKPASNSAYFIPCCLIDPDNSAELVDALKKGVFCSVQGSVRYESVKPVEQGGEWKNYFNVVIKNIKVVKPGASSSRVSVQIVSDELTE